MKPFKLCGIEFESRVVAYGKLPGEQRYEWRSTDGRIRIWRHAGLYGAHVDGKLVAGRYPTLLTTMAAAVRYAAQRKAA